MNKAKAVTVIPPTLSRFAPTPTRMAKKKRVAGYARVSTDFDEQLTSYEAQVDYYTKYIQSKDDWEFVKVYTDEGISATNTKKRDGFKTMIADALAGKIDMIITKSVSRFARNTVDTLTTVRQLKDKGVEVYFEKENIYTLDSKGELLITIMSSLAQEESRSISENVTWGQRKRFADGKVTMPYKRFLGYEKGENGVPQIVEEEAKVVRQIYQLFLDGKTPSSIAKRLTAERIPTPAGKKEWQTSTVLSILKNEKYKGDAVLQKSFTVDFLTKKKKVNEGEIPQYYVTGSHPAIVTPEVYDLVQFEITRRKKSGAPTSSETCFSSKIFCAECGSAYGSKVWHSNDQYRRTVWQCNGKFKGKGVCKTPHLSETEIQQAFIKAFNELVGKRIFIIRTCEEIIRTLTKTDKLEATQERLTAERDEVIELMRKCVEENASAAIDHAEYTSRYGKLANRYESAMSKLEKLATKRLERSAKRENVLQFLQALKETGSLLTEFNEELWNVTVAKVTVYRKDYMVFTFKDGRELPVNM